MADYPAWLTATGTFALSGAGALQLVQKMRTSARRRQEARDQIAATAAESMRTQLEQSLRDRLKSVVEDYQARLTESNAQWQHRFDDTNHQWEQRYNDMTAQYLERLRLAGASTLPATPTTPTPTPSAPVTPTPTTTSELGSS